MEFIIIILILLLLGILLIAFSKDSSSGVKIDKRSESSNEQKNQIQSVSTSAAIDQLETASKKSTSFSEQDSSQGTHDEIETIDVVVGLDFGTSLTKVVTAAPDVELHYAVPFDEDNNSVERFLKPTVLYRSNDTDLFSISPLPGAIAISNLKLKLINWADSRTINEPTNIGDPVTNAVIYLALIIRDAKAYFIEASSSELASYEPRWMLNLGIPASNLRDDKIKIVFEKTAYAAWDLAFSDNTPTKERAKDSWEKICKKDFMPGGSYKDYINIYPELAAQIVGFIKSKYGQDGLYLMMDVGAGTIDVALFDANIIANQIINEGDIKYLTGCVAMLGCLELFQERLSAIRLAKDDFEWGKNLATENIGTLPFEELVTCDDNVNIAVTQTDNKFLKRCSDVVYKEIGRAKQKYFKKAPPGKGALHSGLPYFLCGGGSNLEIYKEIIEKLGGHDGLMRNFTFGGFKKKLLNKPECLTADHLDQTDYHRISVAFGLSHFILNLPEQHGFAEALLDNQAMPRSKDRNGRKCRYPECNNYPMYGDDVCERCR